MTKPRETDDYFVDCRKLDDAALIVQAERALKDRGHWPDGHVLSVVLERLKERLNEAEK